MTEQELAKLITLQKSVSETFEEIRKEIDADSFKELDGWNKDLLYTEANALQTLLGLVTMRIGLNISSVKTAAANTGPEEQENDVQTAERTEQETSEEQQ